MGRHVHSFESPNRCPVPCEPVSGKAGPVRSEDGCHAVCWAVAEIVNRMKGSTSHALRQEFPSLRSRLPTLWSRSYYAGTVGHVSEATVRAYIEAQKAP